MFENLINIFDPRKVRWWEKDEWHLVEKEYAHYIVEEHGCPSWDIETCDIVRYKSKETCEDRQRKQRREFAGETTKFTNPENEIYYWRNGWSGREFQTKHIDNYDIYEGPDWERK